MNTIAYPLGHEPSELKRLDAQAILLADPLLEQLAAKASSCLEIGCGNGSNLPLLRKANSHITYTGIDISTHAIEKAQEKFGKDTGAHFQVLDANSLKELGSSYDLIFTKLVLWSIGPTWTSVLQNAYQLLAPGGTFYALEPCNQFIHLEPEKPAAKAWMHSWDEAALKSGLDPFIGPKVANALQKAGFGNITAKFHPIIALGEDSQQYQAIIENLKGFYMGPASDHFNMTMNSKLKKHAIDELDSFNPSDLVMDALFVSTGEKTL